MQFSLNTIVIKPEKNVTINNAVILLHGYGGDAKDISMLTLNWKRFLSISMELPIFWNNTEPFFFILVLHIVWLFLFFDMIFNYTYLV